MNNLALTKEIYDIDSISDTMKAFSSIAEIGVDEDEEHFYVHFCNEKCATDILISEFENYCIDIINKEKKW